MYTFESPANATRLGWLDDGQVQQIVYLDRKLEPDGTIF